MPKRSGVTIEKNDFAKVAANVRGAVSQQVRLCTLDLLSESVRLAPVEEGILRGSGSAHFDGERIATGADFDVEAKGDEGIQGGDGTTELTGSVNFNTVYAAAQHERIDFAHPKGGQAKYLESPLERNRLQYQNRILDAAKKEMGG